MSSHTQAGGPGSAQRSGSAGTQPETHTGDSAPRLVCERAMVRRLRKLSGKRYGKRTLVKVEFELFTPRGYFDPATDEILHIDLADAISRHVTDFHDVPGYRLRSYRVNGEEIL
jgi:hypothetical protein